VLFRKVAQTTHSLEYANIRFGLDFDPVLDQLEQLGSAIDTHMDAEYYKDTPHMQYMAFRRLQVNKLIARVNTLQHLAYKVAKPSRKRFAFSLTLAIIAASASAMAIGAAIYTRSEINGLNRAQNLLDLNQETLNDGLSASRRAEIELATILNGTLTELEFDHETIALSGWITETLSIAERRIQTFESLYASAGVNRLSINALAEFDLLKAQFDLAKYAGKLSLSPIMSHLSDWLQFDCSLHETDHGFEVFIHVPLYTPGSELYVYQHLPIPIDLGNDFHVTVTAPTASFLAISQDRTLFRNLSPADYESCARHGSFLACPKSNWVHKTHAEDAHAALRVTPPSHGTPESSDLCLRAMFTHQWELARRTCTVSIGPAAPTIHQLSPNQFLLTSPFSHGGTVICRNQSTAARRHFTVKQATFVTVPSGCSASTAHFHFMSSDAAFDKDLGDWAVNAEWPMSPQDLSHDIDLQKLHALRLDAAHTLANTTALPLHLALKAVNEYKSLANPADWAPMIRTNGLTLLSFMLSLLSLLLIWLIHFSPVRTKVAPRNEHLPPAYPTAPPANSMHIPSFNK
jgi:hypothetical protein